VVAQFERGTHTGKGHIMNERGQIDPRNENLPLARWLQEVMAANSTAAAASAPPENENNEYHPYFYQQLPDFITALLEQQPRATLHFAPLLYHLIGCTVCHSAYLDLYSAMRAAIQPDEVQLNVGQRTGSWEATPVRMVVQLCQSFIRQAEALYRQSRRDHTNESIQARFLLQQALRISARITQSNMRTRALHDLVRIASLFDDFGEPMQQGPAVHSYSPVLAGGSHGRAMRRAETIMRPTANPSAQDAIYLQSNLLEGRIMQQGDTLELFLQDLDKTLRGHYLSISVPLGSLIEPIRWVGGNPRTIHSIAPVDERGMLNTPLGRTELRLGNQEERNLLEATFLLLEVRTIA
jgi:hypothetical protein